MRNLIFLVLFAFLWIPTAHGQTTGTVTGVVTATDATALTGAMIVLDGTPFSARPGTDGRYTISDVPVGEYTLSISGGGFSPQQQTIAVQDGGTTIVDLQLETLKERVDVVASLAEYQVDETSTATKTATRLLDVPQSVQVFPNQLIEDRAILEGNELFRNISGINQSTYSAMIFRGFTQREILYNGARGNPFGSLEGDVNGSGFSTSQIRLTNIQRVEVLKGPVAALYGSSEPGGLINYVTKKPRETIDGEFQVRLGSFNQKYGSGEITGPVTENLFYRGAFYAEDRDSFRFNAESENQHAVGNLAYRLNERTNFGFEYEFIKQELPGQRLRGVPVDAAGNFLTNIEWTATEPTDFIKLDAHVLQFRGDHDFGRDLRLDYTLRYLNFDRDEEYHEPRGLNAVTAAGRTMRREFRRQLRNNDDFSFVANLNKPFNFGSAGVHRVLIGGEFVTQGFTLRSGAVRERERGGPVPPIDLFSPVYGLTSASDYGGINLVTDTANTKRGGFYAQDQVTLNKYFQFLVSGRIDSYQDEGFSSVPLRAENTAATGRVGAVFKPVDRLSLYGSYANTFVRPPIIAQTPSANGPFEPETGNQVEFGIKGEVLNRRLSLTAAVFNINKENILRPDPNQGPSGTNFNAVLQTGAARSRGFEFNANGFLRKAWYVAFNYAYLDTEITEDLTASLIGQPLPNAAPHTVGLFTRYDFLRNTGVGLGFEYVDDRIEPFAGIRAPEYSVVDLSLYQRLTSRARLQVQVTNVFDEEYAVSSLFAARAGNFPGQPRAVIVTLSFTPFRR